MDFKNIQSVIVSSPIRSVCLSFILGSFTVIAFQFLTQTQSAAGLTCKTIPIDGGSICKRTDGKILSHADCPINPPSNCP